MIWCFQRKSRTLSQWLAGLISELIQFMLNKKGLWPGLWKRRSLMCVFSYSCESVFSAPFSKAFSQSPSGRSFIIFLQPFYHPHEMKYCYGAGMLLNECTCIFHRVIKHTKQIGFIWCHSDLPCNLHFSVWKVSLCGISCWYQLSTLFFCIARWNIIRNLIIFYFIFNAFSDWLSTKFASNKAWEFVPGKVSLKAG